MSRSAVVVMCVLFLLAAPLTAAGVKTSATFALSVPGMIAATFHSCEGLGSESAVIEYRDGSTGETRKLPGSTKWSDITLKRGVSADGSLAAWRKLVEDGDAAGARKGGSIILYDHEGKQIARFTFTDAWPRKISIDSDPETGLPIETLVLTVESTARQ